MMIRTSIDPFFYEQVLTKQGSGGRARAKENEANPAATTPRPHSTRMVKSHLVPAGHIASYMDSAVTLLSTLPTEAPSWTGTHTHTRTHTP